MQFLIVWLVAPVFAILGGALTWPSNKSATLAGWLLTLGLWSAFGARSTAHRWKNMPRTSGERWPRLSSMSAIEMRMLIGIGLVTLLSILAMVTVLGMLVAEIALTVSA